MYIHAQYSLRLSATGHIHCQDTQRNNVNGNTASQQIALSVRAAALSIVLLTVLLQVTPATVVIVTEI
jgi:hypothetical protein